MRHLIRLILVFALVLSMFPTAALAQAQLTPDTIDVPAGTHILVVLTSPIHTTSTRENSAVFGQIAQPVVAGGRVALPAASFINGTVVHERRPGRIRGRAQLRFTFDNIVLPNNQVVPLAAKLQSVPGSPKLRTRDDQSTLEPVDQIDHDVYTVGGSAIVGAIGGYAADGAGGAAKGAALTGAVAVAEVLFSRGDEISLPAGSTLEIVLSGPIRVPVLPASMQTQQSGPANQFLLRKELDDKSKSERERRPDRPTSPAVGLIELITRARRR